MKDVLKTILEDIFLSRLCLIKHISLLIKDLKSIYQFAKSTKSSFLCQAKKSRQAGIIKGIVR